MSDLISRSALIDFILNRIVTTDNEAHYHKKIFIEAVKMQPTIEAVPVVNGFNDNRNYHEVDEFRCSECGLHLEDWSRHVYDEELDDEFIKEYAFKYCPECGAKIGGAE